jgi:uncharacterized protein YggU (UPF0235/DUF167 family)
MRITAIVTPNAAANKVIQVDEATYRVYTTATPKRGTANHAILKLLAEFLDMPPSRLVIRFGRTAREKMVEVLD